MQIEEENITTPTKENTIYTSDKDLEEGRSNCSTPTIMKINTKSKVWNQNFKHLDDVLFQENGYESDHTLYNESDCDFTVDVIDDHANQGKCSYEPIHLNISEISDPESEEEDPGERSKRIEKLAAAINIPNKRPLGFNRGELNMEIDTLSERSEEEEDREEQKPRQKTCRASGRKRSMSRDRNVAKIRFIIRRILRD